MNTKNLTHPELVGIAHDLLERNLPAEERAELSRLRDSRTMSRKEKQRLASLAGKYRYQSRTQRFQA